MIKKVIAAVFAGLLVVSFANISNVKGDSDKGYYKYKITCKAPHEIPIINNEPTHSATTLIKQSKLNRVNVKYHTVVRAELYYNNGSNRVIYNTNKLDNLYGLEEKDNKIVVKKKMRSKCFVKTYHDMTLGGIGANYSACWTFRSSDYREGTRKF